MSTEVLKLDELVQNQGTPEDTVNTALRQLEGRTVRVLSRTLDAEPGSPAAGDAYIITGSATGTDWGGYDEDDIAHYYGGAWHNVAPLEGWRVWVNDDNEVVGYKGSAWENIIDGTAIGAGTAITTIDASGLARLASGVNFNASGGDTLSDYVEKISFTPVLVGSSTPGSPTYTAQVGYYWRTGNNIHIYIDIHLSAIGGIVGNLKITGYPIAAASAGPTFQGMEFPFYQAMSLPASNYGMKGLIAAGASIVLLYSSSNTTSTALTEAHLNATSRMIVSGTYNVD